MNICMELAQQYREMHQNEATFAGYSILPHVGSIKKLISKHGAQNIIDYGCGKAAAYTYKQLHKQWNVNVRLYDPYYGPYSRPPEEEGYDGVVCTDVLEHVPEEELDGVLEEIFDLADDFVFLTVCTRPAKKTLPDGRNCHLTVKDEDWWRETIGRYASDVETVVEFTE